MAKRVGTWWIEDGLVERKLEAQGFGEILDLLSDFNWTQDHGNSNVLERDFVETAAYTEKVDQVDYMFMCSHGNPNEFVTWDGRVNCAQPLRNSALGNRMKCHGAVMPPGPRIDTPPTPSLVAATW